MKVNSAKERMLRGEPAFGYALGLGSPLAAEALGGTGIDFLLLDTQHGSWGPDSTISALSPLTAWMMGRDTAMASKILEGMTVLKRGASMR